MHYCADRMPAMIFIGMETESGVTEIRFDVSSWLGRWPGMAISLLAATPGGSVYPTLAALEGSELVWRVTDADTSVPGSGRIELVGTLDGIRKISASAATQIQPRLPGTAGDAPDPAKPWVDSVREAADRITGMQVAAETLEAGSDATAQWDGDAGLLTIGLPRGDKGATGPQGPKGDTGLQGPQGVPGADGKDAVVDATLTQSGQAADAKVTGDAIGQLKSEKADKKDIPEPYTLPTASADTLGGFKVGNGLVMDGEVLGVKPEGEYELIETITIKDVDNVSIVSVNVSGYKKIKMVATIPSNNTENKIGIFTANNFAMLYSADMINSSRTKQYSIEFVFRNGAIFAGNYGGGGEGESTLMYDGSLIPYPRAIQGKVVDNIYSIAAIMLNNNVFPAGSVFSIEGVRANA